MLCPPLRPLPRALRLWYVARPLRAHTFFICVADLCVYSVLQSEEDWLSLVEKTHAQLEGAAPITSKLFEPLQNAALIAMEVRPNSLPLSIFTFLLCSRSDECV